MTGYDSKTMASLTSNLRAMLPTIAEEEGGAATSDANRSAIPPASETTSMLLHWASALQRCITPIVKELDSLKGRMDDVERKLQAGIPSAGLLCGRFDRQLADLEQREEEHRSRLTQAVVQVAEEVHRFCKSAIALPVIGDLMVLPCTSDVATVSHKTAVEIAPLPCSARKEDPKSEALPLPKESRRDGSCGPADSVASLDTSTRSMVRHLQGSLSARDSLQRASEDFDDAIHASLRLILPPAQPEQKQGQPVHQQQQQQQQQHEMQSYTQTQTQPGSEASKRPSSPFAWVNMQAANQWAFTTPSTSVDALSDTTTGSSLSDLAPSIGQLSGRRPLSADRTTNLPARRSGSVGRSGTSSQPLSPPLRRASPRPTPDGSFPVIPAVSSRSSLPARVVRPTPMGSAVPLLRSPQQLASDRISTAGHLDAQPLSARSSSSTASVAPRATGGPVGSSPCNSGPIGSSSNVGGGSCAVSLGGASSSTAAAGDNAVSNSPPRASSLGVSPLRASAAGTTTASHVQKDHCSPSLGIAAAALASFNDAGQPPPRAAGSTPPGVPTKMAAKTVVSSPPQASSSCKAWNRQGDLSCRAIRR